MKYKNNLLRLLARTSTWQSLYTRAKDLACLQLFENKTDLSRVQLIFLYWLDIYWHLNQAIIHQDPLISEEVLKDDIRTDAYILWKTKYSDNTKTKQKTRTTEIDSKIPSIIFKGK